MAIRTQSVPDAALLHGREIVFPPHPLATAFCTGFGLELGSAAHNPFDLPGSVNGAPEEHDPVYVQSQIQLCKKYDLVDIICNGHEIPFPNTSLDYCLSSHVVEHFPNPIANFIEWNRILKPGGIIFTIIPKRDALESDKSRPISSLTDITDVYRRHGNGQVSVVDAYSHCFVWTLNLMVSLILFCNEHVNLGWDILYTEETDTKVGNGHTIVARRRDGTAQRSISS